MKKILITLLAVVAFSAFAADTVITGFDAQTGIGTFKVVSDGTDCTLTVDKLVVSDASTLPGGYVSNVVVQTATVAATVTPQAGATVTAESVVTPQTVSVPQTWTLQTVSITDTNGVTALVVTGIVANVSVAVCTNATVATSIANGAGLLTNVTATTAGVTTNVTVTRK